MTTKPDPFKVEIYRGKKMFRQVWRWRVKAANGNILADSAEAYVNYGDAKKIVDELFPHAPVVTKASTTAP